MSNFSLKVCTCIQRIFFITCFISLFSLSICDTINRDELKRAPIKSIYDLTNKDILSLFIVGCFGSIAVSAGGGGGIISMPIFLGLMCVPFSQAVTFSSAVILGGVICALLSNLLQHKRELFEYQDAITYLKTTTVEDNLKYTFSIKSISEAPLIDVQIVLFIAPLLTAGSLFGVSIGRYISNITSIIILDFLLVYALRASILKFYKIREIEIRLSNNEVIQCNGSNEYSLTSSKSNIDVNDNLKDKFKIILYLYIISVISLEQSNPSMDNNQKNTTQTITSGNKPRVFKNINFKYWVYFLVLCLFSIWISILDSGILFTKGIFLHYLLWLSSVLLLLLFPIISLPKDTLNLITSIINSQDRLVEFFNYIANIKPEYEYHSSDILSFIKSKSSSNVINYFLSNLEILAVGIVGGITGASGAVLISAIFFTSQVDPSSIAANNSTCLVISTLTCFYTYLFEGRVYFDLALLMLFVSILCTLIGKNIIDYYVRKYKLSSIIIGIVICLILSSLIYMNVRLFLLLKNGQY